MNASNVPTEIDLLRRIASAAIWAIESNGDDVVGRDGRTRVGVNWVSANGELARTLEDLRLHYGIENRHAEERERAAALEAQMRNRKG